MGTRGGGQLKMLLIGKGAPKNVGRLIKLMPGGEASWLRLSFLQAMISPPSAGFCGLREFSVPYGNLEIASFICYDGPL